MKSIFTLIISIFILSTLNAQTKIEISDFKILKNTNWQGTLTYKNYSDGKEVTLAATLKILLKKNKIITEISFPKEPEANSKRTIKIKRSGTYLGREKVINREILQDGFIKITTLFKGKDNNKKAKIRQTYLFNKDYFSITKEVEYLDSGEKILRNKQNYKRIKKDFDKN